MSNTVITHKANSTGGSVPTAGQLAVAELAINTGDGKVFSKMANGTVIQLNAGSVAGSNTQVQFNDSGAFGGSAGMVFDKVSNNFTISNTITVGNSTVNSVVNSTSIKVQNSTVNSTFTVPTSAQWTGNYFLQANGSCAISPRTGAIGATIDGGGSVITTGIKGDIGPFPHAMTIQDVTLIADQSGSIVFDIWVDTYANYPPTVADTITASAKPTITAATKSQDTTLTGWTTSLAAGSIARVNIDSVTTITRCTMTMKVVRT